MRTRNRVDRRRKLSHHQPATRSCLFEPFEERLVLSASTLVQAINWQGVSTEAFAGQWVLSLDGLHGGLLDQQAALKQDFKNLGLADQFSVDTHLGRDGLFRIDTQPQLSYDDVFKSVSKLAGFAYLEPDFVLTIDAVPDDPSFGDLWGLENTGQSGGTPGADISAVEAWDTTTGSSNVVVGVVDTGIDYTHPDLADNIWINPGETAGDFIDNDGNGYVDDVYGWDFYFNDADPMDFKSHGTHVAGTIGAVGNNATGVTGVNWDVSLMALKIASDDPATNTVSSSAATAALNYVADMRTNHGINIRVTNHSWGGGGISTALQNAILLNEAADILLVAAAGNDSQNTDTTPHYPSSFTAPNVISVASTTRTDALSSFSNYGAVSVDLGAPGSSVYSTVLSGGYGTKSGTSMATPHVTGVAALAWSYRPNATYQEIKDAILQGVDPIPALSTITASGGRLNAATTLQLLGLNATPISPADGEVVAAPPTAFTVQFSSDIDVAGTLEAGDFLVNGIPADTFNVDALDQITFNFNTSPVTLEGLQTMTMPADAVLRASDGFGLNELAATFRYDITTLAVTSIVPADASVAVYPVTQIDVTFNETIAAGSVGLDDLVLSEGSVTMAQVMGPAWVRYTVSGIETEGDVDVSLTSTSVTDTFGNPMAPFAATFELDVDQRAVTAFQRVEPYGSLISEDLGIHGRIGTGGDIDTLTVDMLDGETLLAVINPSDPLAVITAEFVGLTAPVVGSPGGSVVVPLTAIAGDQTVSLRITGNQATDYSYDLYRNTLLEPLGAGQSVGLAIDDSRIEIAGTRYALVATADPAGVSTDEMTITFVDAGTTHVDMFLTGLDGTNLAGQTLQLLDPDDQVVATGVDVTGGEVHDAHVAILGYEINTPGQYTLRVTSSVEGRYSLVVTENTIFATEPNNLATDPVRSLDATLKAVGHLGTRLEDGIFTLTINSVASTLDLSGEVGLAAGTPVPLEEQSPGSLTTSVTGTVVVQIQNGTIQILDPTSLDLTEQPGPFQPGNAPADFGAFANLGLGLWSAVRNFLSSATTLQVPFDANLEFDVGGMRLIVNQGQYDYELTGVVNDSYDLTGLVAFSDTGLVGSISVDPGQIGVVTPVDATIDETLEISPGVFVDFLVTLAGSVTASLPFGDAQDIHAVTLQAGDLVAVSTRTPLAGGVSQDLDPFLNVYLPGGTLLASDTNSMDGTNAALTFVAPVSGVYQIAVGAESGFGEYELLVDTAPPSTVTGRHLFYDNSKWDGAGDTSGINSGDTAAIATDKTAYLPGAGTITSASMSSYSRGINGLFVDLTGPHGTLTLGDFGFAMSNQGSGGTGANNTPSTWSAAPAPTAFTVLSDNPVLGTDRVEFIWADNAIDNRYLEVRVFGDDAAGGNNTNTGLAATDIFYFGSKVGDTFVGTSATVFLTSGADEIGIQASPIVSAATITSVFDMDRNGAHTGADRIVARTYTITALTRINIGSPPAAPAPPGGDADGGGSAVASALAAAGDTTDTASQIGAPIDLPAAPSAPASAPARRFWQQLGEASDPRASIMLDALDAIDETLALDEWLDAATRRL